jgi:hypothetical protein
MIILCEKLSSNNQHTRINIISLQYKGHASQIFTSTLQLCNYVNLNVIFPQTYYEYNGDTFRSHIKIAFYFITSLLITQN